MLEMSECRPTYGFITRGPAKIDQLRIAYERRGITSVRFGRFYFCNDFNLKGDSEMKRKHLSVKQRMQLIDKFGGKCSACGKQHLTLFTDDVDQRAAIDHIIPLSRGGSNDESNLQLLCTPCNAAKRNMTMDEFLEYRWKQAESERMIVDLFGEIPNLSDCFPKLIRNTSVVDKYNVVKVLHDYVQSGR